MESEQNMATPDQQDTPSWSARKLLRAARSGTLATSKDGQPFTALITPATAADGSILLLLSSLSEHTRHLRADPRCGVMVVGQPDGPNPQTAPRLTLTGQATLADPAFKSHWLVRHPYAQLYADFADFSLWQITPGAGLLVAGFARAFRLRASDLIADPAAVTEISASSPGARNGWRGGGMAHGGNRPRWVRPVERPDRRPLRLAGAGWYRSGYCRGLCPGGASCKQRIGGVTFVIPGGLYRSLPAAY